MTVSPVTTDEQTSAADALTYLQQLLSMGGRDFRHTQSVLSARIPISKYLFGGTLEVDISWCNDRPLLNSALLRTYFGMYEQAKKLVILVKEWAKSAGIIGAKDGHLSSYAFTNMVIYFLQGYAPVRLPVLPTGALNANGCERLELPINSAAISLGILFVDFVRYYTHCFNWGHEVVSVRCGPHALRESFARLQNLSYTTAIHIEDPFELGRNLNCVLIDPVTKTDTLRKAFQELWTKLCCGQTW